MSRRTSLVICTGPRCGSELLCDLLRINGVSFPREHFRPDLNRFGAALANSVATEAYLSQCRSGDGHPVFGTKLFPEFLPLMRANMNTYVRLDADMLSVLFPDAVYVLLTRSDRVGRAISLARALRSDNWSPTVDEAHPPVTQAERDLGVQDIHQVLCEQVASNQVWRDVLADACLDPIRVDYDELVREPAAILDTIATATGASLPHQPRLDSRLVRQSDALSQALRREYLASAARRTDRVARSGGFL